MTFFKSDLRLTQINPGKKYQYVPRDMRIYHVIVKNEHFPFFTDSFLCFFEWCFADFNLRSESVWR